jgi:hypothetical protein
MLRDEAIIEVTIYKQCNTDYMVHNVHVRKGYQALEAQLAN